MLMQAATPEMIASWKSIYSEYKPKLRPNKKTTPQIVQYLQANYPAVEVIDENWQQIVIDNMLMNEFYSEKLPAGKKPTAVIFSVQNTGPGNRLYEQQDEVFKGQPIVAGIELETGFLHIEGSSELWDELFAFRGLDEADLNNFYLVAEYINCLKKVGALESVLNEG